MIPSYNSKKCQVKIHLQVEVLCWCNSEDLDVHFVDVLIDDPNQSMLRQQEVP